MTSEIQSAIWISALELESNIRTFIVVPDEKKEPTTKYLLLYSYNFGITKLYTKKIVTGLGLEPRFQGPKPCVLPLDDPVIYTV